MRSCPRRHRGRREGRADRRPVRSKRFSLLPADTRIVSTGCKRYRRRRRPALRRVRRLDGTCDCCRREPAVAEAREEFPARSCGACSSAPRRRSGAEMSPPRTPGSSPATSLRRRRLRRCSRTPLEGRGAWRYVAGRRSRPRVEGRRFLSLLLNRSGRPMNASDYTQPSPFSHALARGFRDCEQVTFNAETAETKCPRTLAVLCELCVQTWRCFTGSLSTTACEKPL